MPVRMKLQVPLRMPCSDEDLVGGQALRQGGDDRDAAGDAGLEGDGPAVPPGGVEDLGAVRGEQRLVGGDDVLAGGEQVEHGLPGPVGAADDLDGDVDRRVVEDRAQVGGDQLRGDDRIARLVGVADDDAAQHERPAGAGGEAVAVVPAAAWRRRRRRCRSRPGRCRTVPSGCALGFRLGMVYGWGGKGTMTGRACGHPAPYGARLAVVCFSSAELGRRYSGDNVNGSSRSPFENRARPSDNRLSGRDCQSACGTTVAEAGSWP